MSQLLNIITVTKDDYDGVEVTIRSTEKIRKHQNVTQFIIDSSGEDTKEKVRALADSADNVVYHWLEPVGIAAAFNLGLNHASSELVWLLNGGDQIRPDVNLDNLLYVLQKSSADAIIFQNEFSGNKEIAKHPPMWAMWPPVLAWIPHPATFTRRSLYGKYGQFDESFTIAMDYEFWLRCFSKNVTVDTVSIPLTLFDPNGIAATQVSLRNKETFCSIKRHLGNLIRLWLYNFTLITKAWRIYRKGSIKKALKGVLKK